MTLVFCSPLVELFKMGEYEKARDMLLLTGILSIENARYGCDPCTRIKAKKQLPIKRIINLDT
jgi:hypothetical protein